MRKAIPLPPGQVCLCTGWSSWGLVSVWRIWGGGGGGGGGGLVCWRQVVGILC